MEDDGVESPGEQAESEPAIIGKTRWAIPGGYVPLESTGPEPDMVSRDELCLLNTGAELAVIEISLLYDEMEAGPYPLTVAAERVRHIRINDLIDPYAPPLGAAYGIIVEATEPIVVQCTRQDTRQKENASLTSIGWAEK